MGARGPLPNPNARRRNVRVKRGATTLARPPMPREITGEARAEWRRVVKYLDDVGAISPVDRAVLIRYCRAWAEWVELDALVKTTGRLTQGPRGTLVRNPAALLRREAETTLLELSRELALSPSARLRIGIEHLREQDEEGATDGDGIASFEDYREQLRG